VWWRKEGTQLLNHPTQKKKKQNERDGASKILASF
jgi:hypothetical protein